MTIGNIHISDSLYRLIQESMTPCCKLLRHAFERMYTKEAYYEDYLRRWGAKDPDTLKVGRGTRVLNKQLPGNYFSFREREGMISYCPNSKTQEVTEDGAWVRKGRQEMKPARWIKAMLNPRLSKRIKDNLFAEFDTLVKKVELESKITFEEVDFEEAYNESNYDPNCCPGSCMWSEPVGPFYRRMGAQAYVAVNNKGQYLGRTVVWPKVTVDSLNEPITLMDRIYANLPEVIEAFRDYAMTQGWFRKQEQSADALTGVVGPDGARHHYIMSVKASRSIEDMDFCPYMDTFCGSIGTRTMINRESGDGVEYVYRCTGGGRNEAEDEHDGQVQDVDGEWIDEDDARSVDEYYYHYEDPRITTCYRTSDYVLRCQCYEVEISRGETITIHRRFVSGCD